MKLVAAKDFFNAKVLGIKLDPKSEGFRHENHVHKGARFSIGRADAFKDLSPEQKEHVGTLISREIAVIDGKENAENGVIDTIDREAKAELAAHKKALEPAPTVPELVASAVASALAEAGLIKAKT